MLQELSLSLMIIHLPTQSILFVAIKRAFMAKLQANLLEHAEEIEMQLNFPTTE